MKILILPLALFFLVSPAKSENIYKTGWEAAVATTKKGAERGLGHISGASRVAKYQDVIQCMHRIPIIDFKNVIYRDAKAETLEGFKPGSTTPDYYVSVRDESREGHIITGLNISISREESRNRSAELSAMLDCMPVE